MDNKQATLELGTKPMGRLLMQYALPAIIAMTASSLYNTIDSIFIGQGVGPLAISGLAITFPLMNLASAFGAAVGAGSLTCISIKLGQKDYAMAQQVFGTSIVLNTIIGISFGVVALIFLDPILYFFGASEQTLPYAHEYMTVILIGNVFSHMFFGMNAILRAASKPRKAMYATIFTVILNVILAPIFIWPLHLGIRGAALATIISQTTVLMWQFKQFCNKDDIIHFQHGIYKLRKNIVKNILAIGISPFSMNVCACIVVIFINNTLVHYGGDLAVGAYGIAHKLVFLFVMVVMGLNQGMFPIAGYNYGAQNLGRVIKVLKYTATAGVIVMTIGFLIVHIWPYQCVRLFTTDPGLIEISEVAVKVNMLALPIVGLQMVATGFFQSIGKVNISIFLALSRNMLFFLPLLFILPPIFKLNGVWMAIPGADIIASIVTIFMLAHQLKKMKKQFNTAI